MRAIKFRGKRVDNGEWVEGFYIKATQHWHKNGIHEDWIVGSAIANGGWFALGYRYPVIGSSIGQYTGLKDKNGVEIYETDSVLYRGKYCEVVFHDSEFALKFNNNEYVQHGLLCEAWRDNFEVIGNIHDNKGEKE